MLHHKPITGAAQHSRAPHQLRGADAPQAADQFSGNHPQVLAKSPDPIGGAGQPAIASTTSEIGAQQGYAACRPTGEAGASNLSPNYADQWRNPPDCKQCGRGYFRCVCEWDEPQQEHFRPAINRDPDWFRGCKAVVAIGAVWATYLTVTL